MDERYGSAFDAGTDITEGFNEWWNSQEMIDEAVKGEPNDTGDNKN